MTPDKPYYAVDVTALHLEQEHKKTKKKKNGNKPTTAGNRWWSATQLLTSADLGQTNTL
jgi:cytolysin (calcineurin-like family phosphatase)